MKTPNFSALPAETAAKLAKLLSLLAEMDSIVVAFSGGVDSSLLAFLGSQVLQDACLAVTVTSALDVPGAVEQATAFAAEHGIQHLVLPLDVLAHPEIASNPIDRCYHCKKLILSQLAEIAAEKGFRHVVEGQNLDDLDDYRPGRIAVQETHTRSPFVEAGLSKLEIRAISRLYGLKTWDAPSSPCLATRIPYGDPIHTETLARIGKAEAYLHSLGIPNCRVRVFGNLASIEVPPEQMTLIFEQRATIRQALEAISFTHCALDLAGYAQGNLNKGLV